MNDGWRNHVWHGSEQTYTTIPIVVPNNEITTFISGDVREPII
jgi:hypothetical protein